MTNYVNDLNTSEPNFVYLGSLDGDNSGVDYVAGNGSGIIVADNANSSINIGHNSDVVILGSGNDYVSLFDAPALIALGSGNNTVAFNAVNGAGPMASQSPIPMDIVFFKGAGDAEPTPSTPHDFLAFYGYGAGASLKLASNDGDGQQSYDILNGSGKVVGEFSIYVSQDHDGTWHTLSSASDYKFYS